MKQLLLIFTALFLLVQAHAQEKKAPAKTDLPDIKKAIRSTIENLPLYTRNLNTHSEEHDVNSIILDIEKYIDSMPKTHKYSDVLLMKQFDALRHFFLTTTNKTTVAASFIYPDVPYRFCLYNDTALSLHIGALRDGYLYNLGIMTENRAIKKALQDCLLPSLQAFDEFEAGEIKYIGLSVYFGCKDTREGAANVPAVPYCLTLVARLADIQQYVAGLITAKGLLTNAELYISNDGTPGEFRSIQVALE
jgi:hypothetical protein